VNIILICDLFKKQKRRRKALLSLLPLLLLITVNSKALGQIKLDTTNVNVVSQPVTNIAQTTSDQNTALNLPEKGFEAQQALPQSQPSNSSSDLLKRIEKLEQSLAKKKQELELPSVKWTAQLQTDAIGFFQNQANESTYGAAPNGLAFRRARIGMIGDYGSINYRLEVDFAAVNRPSFLDVYAAIKDIPGIGLFRVGHFFEPFSLERATANRFTTFMERSLMDQAFVPARNLGAMIRDNFAENRGVFALGIFAADSDANGDSFGKPLGLAITSRLTFLPIWSEQGNDFLHVGVGYSFRESNEGMVRFRAQPELRIGATAPNLPFFANTGSLGSPYYQLIGFEFLRVNGPMAFQSEITLAPVTLKGGSTHLLYGSYAEVGWFITNDHRRYRLDNGTADRVIPNSAFITSEKGSFAHGTGAIELAMRLSYVQLTNGPIRGGSVLDYTIGVNWYLNQYLRMSFNYVYSLPELANKNNAGFSQGLGLRMNFDF
jgi:phosphate-selective porin OprO and OprP